MIPASDVHPQAAEALLHYLVRELPQAKSERQPLEERWQRFEKSYRALPEVEIKEFPFLGAANLVIPVVATDVDTIFARIMGILFAPENLFSVRALRPEMVDYAPRVQEFLRWSQDNELNAYDAIADFTLQMCKLGTGILKQRYKRTWNWVYQFRETPQGSMEQIRQAMVNDHPVLEMASLYDCLTPTDVPGIQESPWFAEKICLTPEQYGERVQAGIYHHSERITRAHMYYVDDPLHQLRAEMDAFRPTRKNQIDFWEVWVDWDISGMGRRMPLVVTVHLPSQTIVRMDYNPFLNQERPYSSARFLRQDKRWLGIGLAEMLMPFQDEVTAMHNQRIDVGTLANSVMWKAKKNIGIAENEPVWPGRWFLLDDMNDVQSMPIGAQFDVNVTYENVAMDYARRRTGVNDYMAGQTGPSTSYATATASISLLQEAARKIDQTLREVRGAIGESGTRILELYQQFDQGGKVFSVMGEKEGAMVQQILQFPLELMRYSIGVEPTATSASLNKEVEIRTNQIVMGQVTEFYQQMFQGMSILVNPQIPQPLRNLAAQMLTGGSVMMRRLLDSYGVQDTDRIIPDVREVMGAGQSQAGGGNLIPGMAGSPGMAGIPQGAPGVSPGGVPLVGAGY